MHGWPSNTEYKAALQHPQRIFAAESWFKTSRPPLDKNQFPHGINGGYAVVFRMTDGVDVRALKCFTEGDRDMLGRRYRGIQDYLDRTTWPPFMIPFRFHVDVILVQNEYFPALEMNWNDGVCINKWLAQQLAAGNAKAIRDMAGAWCELVLDLADKGLVHGDLQHGNVMVVGDRLALVDYDGMFIPGVLDAPPEDGLPNYQHPLRKGQAATANLDRFSAWVILLALRAAAADLQFFAGHEDYLDDTILFFEEDLESPRESWVWQRLSISPDPDVVAWAKTLQESLGKPFADVPAFVPYSLDKLQAACRTQPVAWEEIDRHARSIPVKKLSAQERTLVEEASRRMAARDRLVAALSRNPPALREIAGHYDPLPFAGWKFCETLVTQGVEAQRVHEIWARLQVLQNDLDASAAFVALWTQHEPALLGYAEPRALQDVVNARRQIVSARQDLESAQRNHQVRAFLAAVDSLRKSNAHAILQPLDAEIRTAEARLQSLEKLEQMPRAETEDADRAFCAAWESAQELKGTPDAAELEQRHRLAGKRVQVLDQLHKWVENPALIQSLADLQTQLQQLPAGYEYKDQERLRDVAKRREVARNLGIALKGGLPRAIQPAWVLAQQHGVTKLKKPWPEMCRWAVDVCKCLDALHQLNQQKGDLPRDAYDQEWLRLWDDKLLQGCKEPELKALRQDHEMATRRSQLWAKLKSALDDRAPLRVAAVMDEAVLGDYPPVVLRRAEIKELMEDAARIQASLASLTKGAKAAAAQVDFDCVRRYPQYFDEMHDAVERIAQQQLDAVRLRSSWSPDDEPPADGVLRLTWHWDQWARLRYRCFYAISPTRGLNTPKDGDPLRGEGCAVIDEERYQRHGLGVSLVADAIWVTIWPVVALGWKDIAGPPLVIGPIAGKKPRKWFG